ncbi:spermidine/putrescine ABC transporter substrate-binding protein [Kineobactrum sediminis]|uniref:Spermidine/putrescine ABC transporter substrate-binding protein n=1 Tax=Kineobactrum sediminis TaxID=1905677 RepID=A0A2N5Y1I9_9GAMM|nr:ABC transporter substrate-binding protein [Kineobactrum sediminis]PLW82254.1 spermidine/putrescine ABC transporter substrate-binding protein [Kineobactrum sediminis]
MIQRFLSRLLLLLAYPFLVSSASGQESLNVVSWDGAYVKSQILGFVRPYEEKTGVRINVLQYSGGIEEIRRQVRAWNVRWDVVDLELFDAMHACEQGLLERIDPDQLPPAPDGTPAREDFIEGSLTTCGVGNIVGSTVVSYNSERLDKSPQHVRDFFNLADFPGRRGLRQSPQGNLEWALIADGVEREQVYEVLSTPEGIDRAFDVLTRIKPYIDWWRTGEDALRLLETGQVTMSSIFSGRIHEAVERGQPLEILWDHQIWIYDVWGIPKNGRNTELALDFIKFATSTHSLARQANLIPYGPVRRSALQYVEPDMRRMLPTEEHNLTTAIELDAEWWAQNLEAVNQRFDRWISRPFMVPRYLPR